MAPVLGAVARAGRPSGRRAALTRFTGDLGLAEDVDPDRIDDDLLALMFVSCHPVLHVLYAILTEGSTATSGDHLLRPDVAYEAIQLIRTLAALQPDEAEVHGLLALCELTAARFPARTDPDGTPVLLEDQDRRLWDSSAIRRGLAALNRASPWNSGPYALQAAIAATHAAAPSVGFRPCAVSCWPGSAVRRKPASSWNWQPGSVRTSANGPCCCAGRPRWAEVRVSSGGAVWWCER
ncbi:DUF6596 domain-containing protein [Micromonospora sp. NPDC049102]|uniref:DUF6596 domain-containing protein n=1 Tax=Micromonospora sp. NPDC049102 TaxID=3364265 RepID=UPI003714BB63